MAALMTPLREFDGVSRRPESICNYSGGVVRGELCIGEVEEGLGGWES